MKTYTFVNDRTGHQIETTHAQIEIAAAEERAKASRGEKAASWTPHASDYRLMKEYDPEVHDESPEQKAAKKKAGK